jgi:hypothetical protein
MGTKYSEMFEDLTKKADFMKEATKQYYEGFAYRKKKESENLDETVNELYGFIDAMTDTDLKLDYFRQLEKIEMDLRDLKSNLETALYPNEDDDYCDTEILTDEYDCSIQNCDISEQEEKAFDIVNKPKHYNSGKIEVINYIEDVAGQLKNGFEGYCIGNVLKYISRQHLKNGLEDVRKSSWYLNRLIEYKEKNDAVESER